MIVYWVLLLTTAIFAYLIGSLDTLVLASNFVFHRNLRRLGDPSVWLSNFYRIYGVKGFVKLLAVELVRDALPLLIGSLLLGIKGHADAGRAFAGFVLVLARLWPALYGFHGSDASIAFAVAAFAVQPSVGVASAIVIFAVTVLTRYISLGTTVGALASLLVAVLVIDDALLLRLTLMTAGLVILRHIPSIVRIFRHTEPRLSYEKDITYKLDE